MGMISKIFRKRKREIPSTESQSRNYADFDTFHKEIVDEVRPFTMTSPERIYSLIEATRYIVEQNVPGSFVECGVWKGGSVMAMVKTCLFLNDNGRDFYLFDSFEGMPKPGKEDIGYNGVAAEEIYLDKLSKAGDNSGWCLAYESEVLSNLIATGYDKQRFKIISGKVERTLIEVNALPEKISLLRLDTDWYNSTKLEWEVLYPRVVPGGFVIIDDYGHWKGARRATDEFLSKLDPKPFLFRIDYTARMMQKPYYQAGL